MFKKSLSFTILSAVSFSAFCQVIKIDSSFNLVGYHTMQFQPYSSQAGYGVKLNPVDGRYIVRASANGLYGFIKYKQDGTLDSGFNNVGYVIPPGSEYASYNNFDFDSQNRIITGKSVTGSAFWTAFSCTKQNGTPDSSFGVNGTITIPNTPFRGGTFHRLPDGSYITITIIDFDNTPSFAFGLRISKFKNDFTVDNSFGSGGFKDHPLGGYKYMHTLAKPLSYPDGRILVAATTQTAPYNDDAGYDYDMTFVRFLPNGNLDSSFGVNGISQPVYSYNLEEIVYAISFAKDYKIFGMGAIEQGSSRKGFVARLLQDGGIDSTFGVFGKYVNSDLEEIFTAVSQRDGKLIFSGSWGTAYTIGRMTESGTTDLQFGTGGTYKTPFNPPYGFAMGSLLENDTSLIVTGNAFCSNQCDNVTTARYKMAFQPYVTGVPASFCMAGTGSGTVMNMPGAGSDTIVTVLLDNVPISVAANGSFTFTAGAVGQHTIEVRFVKAGKTWNEIIKYTVDTNVVPVISTPNQSVCKDGNPVSLLANMPVYWWGNGVFGAMPATYASFSPYGLTGTQQVYATKFNGACGFRTDTMFFQVVPFSPMISANSNILKTTYTSGASYKWYKSGVLIPGATSNQYLPVQNGDYQVAEGFAGSCSMMSPAFTYTLTTFCPGGTYIISSGIGGSFYQWQLNTGTGFTDISNNANYSGVNTYNLQLTNVSSSWYGYQFRCLVNDLSYNNITTIKIGNAWTGAASTNWENPANWSCGTVPGAQTDVVINSGPIVINSNVTIRSLKIAPGISLTVTPGYTLTITN